MSIPSIVFKKWWGRLTPSPSPGNAKKAQSEVFALFKGSNTPYFCGDRKEGGGGGEW